MTKTLQQMSLRLIATLIAVLACAVVAASAGAEAAAATEASAATAVAAPSPHANLVVVVRFNGDDTTPYNDAYQYNDAYTNWQMLKARFNTQGDSYLDASKQSLQTYLPLVSGGAYEVTSYFPQNTPAADGKSNVGYLTLEKTQAHYEGEASDYTFVNDVIAAVDSAYGAQTSSAWDSDNDGAIDNVDIIVQVSDKVGSTSSILWPHKGNYDGQTKIGGYSVGTYNITNSKALESDMGVIQHEYLHSVGTGDLYRTGDMSSREGPVGVWDIMAQSSWNYPLAQTRADLGWTTIDNVGTSGTYTLYGLNTLTGAEDARGSQAIEVASPLGSGESYVFEYRCKSSDVGGLDHNIAASGLIVYRVNPDTPLDSFGHHSNKMLDSSSTFYEDYLYVFRPGETGLHDSDGSVYEAMLTATGTDYAYTGAAYGQRSSFGIDRSTVENQEKGIVDGAIVDSDGTNTGITVKVIGQTVDSITFTLSLPDETQVDTWDEVGSSVQTDTLNSIQYADATVDDSGTIYQVYWTANGNGEAADALRARMFDGTSWSDLGVKVVSGTLIDPQIDIVDGTLYCTYLTFGNTGGSLISMKYANGAWAQAAEKTLSSTPGEFSTAVDGSSLYTLVSTSGESGFPDTLQLYKLDSKQFDEVGSAISDTEEPSGLTYVAGSKLVVMDGTFYIVTGDYAEISGGSAQGQKVYKLQSGAWSLLVNDLESGFASKVNDVIAADGTLVTFAAYEGQGATPSVKTISADGETVATYSVGSFVPAASDVSLLYRNGYVYLAATDANSATTVWYASIISLDSWTQLGLAAATASTSPVCTTDGKNIYVGYIKSSMIEAGVVSHALVVADSQPEPEPESKNVTRLADTTALGTMVKITSAGWAANSCDTVIVATMDGYWDALSASALAGLDANECPVLITSGTSLSAQAADEIVRLGASRVYVAGGPAAVSEGVRASIGALDGVEAVERLSGDNAVGTALKVYEAGLTAGAGGGSAWGRTCIVATNDGYWDALAASPYAYSQHAPIFLYNAGADRLDDAVVTAIQDGGFEHVIICGGTGAVSETVVTQLAGIGLSGTGVVDRYGGDTAVETSALIAQACVATKAGDNGAGTPAMTADGVAVATVDGYWDALTGAALCGRNDSPLVLASDANRSAITGFVAGHKADISKAYVFGGTAAVSVDTYDAVVNALK